MMVHKHGGGSFRRILPIYVKMMEPKVASGGTDYAKMIQNELLKLMDGDTLTFTDEKNRDTKTTINCSR